MTDQEKVKQRWPDAYVDRIGKPSWREWLYQIRLHTGEPLGAERLTQAAAWADAARRLEDKQ